MTKETELKQQALDQYTPPFSYRGGYIHDVDHKMVADDAGGNHILRIRGWGKLGKLENGAEVQDMIGELIAEALTEYWNTRKPEQN